MHTHQLIYKPILYLWVGWMGYQIVMDWLMPKCMLQIPNKLINCSHIFHSLAYFRVLFFRRWKNTTKNALRGFPRKILLNTNSSIYFKRVQHFNEAIELCATHLLSIIHDFSAQHFTSSTTTWPNIETCSIHILASVQKKKNRKIPPRNRRDNRFILEIDSFCQSCKSWAQINYISSTSGTLKNVKCSTKIESKIGDIKAMDGHYRQTNRGNHVCHHFNCTTKLISFILSRTCNGCSGEIEKKKRMTCFLLSTIFIKWYLLHFIMKSMS